MNDFIAINNIEAVLNSKSVVPSITMWNRLRPYPRRKDFERALRAEVRDAAWMLSRQWQLGEFAGEDAASPIHARLIAQEEMISAYRPGNGATQDFSHDLPLETQVEQCRISFATTEQPLNLDLRLAMGRHWLKSVAAIGDFRSEYLAAYPVDLPDPASKDDAPICAHMEVWQSMAAFAGRAMDGYKLWHHLRELPANRAHDGIAMSDAERDAIDIAEQDFVNWFAAMIQQPEEMNDAWLPSRLEYRFDMATEGEHAQRALTAEEYYSGHLDWFNFNSASINNNLLVPPAGRGLGPETRLHAFLPTGINFEGMPNTRWWAFEDGKTSFGDVDADTTDLAKLLMVEFGLIYANDWFLLPVSTTSGSVLSVAALAVTNVFGERLLIESSAEQGGPDDGFSMFGLSGDEENTSPAVLMLPTVQMVMQQRAYEEIVMIRDEMANMVWGIEHKVPMADGSIRLGREAGEQLRSNLARLHGVSVTVPPQDSVAPWRYKLMTSVPENWIPFIAAQEPGSDSQVRLQRGSMPRIFDDAATLPSRIKPRTSLLRTGLDNVLKQALFMHEEEVPRAGVRVTTRFQRTRWYGGRPVIWLGHQKTTGRGEGSSGQAFDQLVAKKN